MDAQNRLTQVTSGLLGRRSMRRWGTPASRPASRSFFTSWRGTGEPRAVATSGWAGNDQDAPAIARVCLPLRQTHGLQPVDSPRYNRLFYLQVPGKPADSLRGLSGIAHEQDRHLVQSEITTLPPNKSQDSFQKQFDQAVGAICFFHYGFLSRTPGPPTFLSMKITPAFSRATWMAARVASGTPRFPRSMRATEPGVTSAIAASRSLLQPNRARPSRIWAGIASSFILSQPCRGNSTVSGLRYTVATANDEIGPLLHEFSPPDRGAP